MDTELDGGLLGLFADLEQRDSTRPKLLGDRGWDAEIHNALP
ncbi:hypothetical protein [Streptomyces sp. NPDC055400]